MKIFRKLFYFIGAVLMLYGLAVVAIIGTGNWFNFVFVIAGALVILLPLVWRICNTKFKILLLILIGLFAANCTMYEMRAAESAGSSPQPDADYVIVLGAKVNGETPSLEFSERINAACDYLKANPSSNVITTGGQGSDEDLSEGEAAARMLRLNGINNTRITVESESTTTEENLIFAKEAAGLNGDEKIVIITSAFHIYRASKLAEECGLGNVSYSGTRGLRVLLPYYYFREYAAAVRTGMGDFAEMLTRRT